MAEESFPSDFLSFLDSDDFSFFDSDDLLKRLIELNEIQQTEDLLQLDLPFNLNSPKNFINMKRIIFSTEYHYSPRPALGRPGLFPLLLRARDGLARRGGRCG